jgi:hypothetical protein
MDKETPTGYEHVQPTPDQIRKHLKGGTGQVIVHGYGGKSRITDVRVVGNRQKKLQGKVFGFEGFTEDNQWMDIPQDARIDLL